MSDIIKNPAKREISNSGIRYFKTVVGGTLEEKAGVGFGYKQLQITRRERGRGGKIGRRRPYLPKPRNP